MNTTPVRRFTPEYSADQPALIEATDGGAYIRVGDVELAIVPPNQADADRTFTYAVQAHAAIAALLQQGPAALADLDALIAELGIPCGTCEGSKGREVAPWTGQSWVDCPACEGVGRVPAGKAAA
jgi:hypothetical protein